MKSKTAYFGMFVALALIFSYIETLIPIHFAIPGIKLGLANLIIVIALYKLDVKTALVLSVVRVVLAGFMFGNLFSIIYSLAGCTLSLMVMVMLKRYKGFSVIGISLGGGIFHNIGQLLVAMITLESYRIAYYIPVLMVAGIITGLIIGILANEILKRIVKIRM